MGGSHTQVLVDHVWRALLGTWHRNITGTVNEVIRKVGHFFGYGAIGLLFRNAWHSSIRAHLVAINHRWLGSRWLSSRVMLSASGLSVLSTFVVAGLDEWHQRYLPGRVGSLRDVLLDTTGALALNLAFGACAPSVAAARATPGGRIAADRLEPCVRCSSRNLRQGLPTMKKTGAGGSTYGLRRRSRSRSSASNPRQHSPPRTPAVGCDRSFNAWLAQSATTPGIPFTTYCASPATS